jgi:all-trans-nonaprenyl-diphosphate synthase
VLFALEEQPCLEALIDREFAQEGDLEQALKLIADSQGIQRARELAAHHAKVSSEHIAILEPSESRQALINMTDYVLSRLY